MSTKTILTITDQPGKWSIHQDNTRLDFNLIITNNTGLKELLLSNNKTDLLIISQQIGLFEKLDIQSISSCTGARYTLVVPADNEDHFINNDFSKVAHSLLSLSSNKKLITDDSSPSFLPEAGSPGPQAGSSICLNGFLLGPFHILLNGLFINDFSGRKSESLLAFLLYNNRRPCFRETLMEKFWPDVHADSARNSLNVAIHGIRQLFREFIPKKELLVYKNDKYFINPEIDVKLDHEDFLFRLKKGQRTELQEGIQHAISDYEQAVRLYKGDFLENSNYDEWSHAERESIKESYLYVLDKLSWHFTLSGKYKLALHYCRKILEKEACREDIHRRMMRCLHLTGHRDLAVKQYQKCEIILSKELDIWPSKETRALLDEIKSG